MEANIAYVTYPDIRRWIDDRGINPVFYPDRDSFAFAVIDKILEKGYEAKPWIEKTLNDPRIAEAAARVADRVIQEEIDEIDFT